jgi:tetratricopeptide (TPR) repeat protein
MFIVVAAIAALISTSVAHGAEPSVNPNSLPMFGQPKIARTDAEKKADEAFIRDNTLRFKTRPAGAIMLASQGWAALRVKQLDVAMERFNQAWLMNPKYYGAFWGFGAVLSQRGRLLDAIEQLEMARALIDEPAQRPALLADLGALYSEYAAGLPADKQLDRAQYFVQANSCFTESLENDSKFATGWLEWAISLYDQERYSEAWVKGKRYQELRGEPLPADFRKKLSAKMPEPK